jgi:hypothetical protein
MPLDRNKPFGRVCGDSQGRVFEQDGRFYRGDGSEWGSGPVVAALPVGGLAAPAALDVVAPLAVVDDQVAQQMDEPVAEVASAALESLGLPSKIENALRGAKIETVEALVACTEDQLIALPNIGVAACKAIKAALKKAGKKLS